MLRVRLSDFFRPIQIPSEDIGHTRGYALIVSEAHDLQPLGCQGRCGTKEVRSSREGVTAMDGAVSGKAPSDKDERRGICDSIAFAVSLKTCAR